MEMEEGVVGEHLVGDLHDGEVQLMQYLGAHPLRRFDGSTLFDRRLLWLTGVHSEL
jgi:hypothetical protein